MGDNNSFWSRASKDGLILGGVSVLYVLLVFVLGKIQAGTAGTVIVNLLSSVLWAVKLWASLYLLRLFVHRWQGSAETEEERPGGFKYGAAVSLLSALVYSGFHFAYISFVTPDVFTQTIEMMIETGMMDANTTSMMEQMAPSMPLYSFIGNFIYCTIFGIIATSIFAKPKQNPFQE